MPLIHGKSQESFSKNVGKEIDAGKSRAQSLAIAYNMKRRMAQKKAKGGMIHKEVNRPEEKSEMFAHGGMTSGTSMTDLRKNQMANAFKSQGGMIEKHHKYAKGGMIENEDLNPHYEPEHGAEHEMVKEFKFSPHAEEHEEIEEPEESMRHYMPAEEDTPSYMFAHGGMAKAIMKKRMMSEGGMISEYPAKDYVASGTYPSRGAGKEEITNLGHDEDMDQNADFLSDEEQDPFAHHNEFDEFKEKPRRRSILDSIMRAR